jgi:cell division protein FtsN
VQVGAFKNKQLAERFKQHLQSLYIEPVNIAKSTKYNTFYRVQIGPIKNMTEANEITQRLQDIGINIRSLPRIEA